VGLWAYISRNCGGWRRDRELVPAPVSQSILGLPVYIIRFPKLSIHAAT